MRKTVAKILKKFAYFTYFSKKNNKVFLNVIYSNVFLKLFTGGFSDDKSIQSKTRNKFSTPFKGCIQDINFENESTPHQHDFSSYEGENIGECELYE